MNNSVGPETKYAAWRVCPFNSTLPGEVFEDRDAAIRAARKLDGDDNWMIEGLTAERYERARQRGKE